MGESKTKSNRNERLLSGGAGFLIAKHYNKSPYMGAFLGLFFGSIGVWIYWIYCVVTKKNKNIEIEEYKNI